MEDNFNVLNMLTNIFDDNILNITKYVIKKSNNKIKYIYYKFSSKKKQIFLNILKEKIEKSIYIYIENSLKIEKCLTKNNYKDYYGFIFWKINELDNNKKIDFKIIMKEYENFFKDCNKYIIGNLYTQNLNIFNKYKIKHKINYYKYKDINNIYNKIKGDIDILQAYTFIDLYKKTNLEGQLWIDEIIYKYKDIIKIRINELHKCSIKKLKKSLNNSISINKRKEYNIVSKWMLKESMLEKILLYKNLNIKNTLKKLHFGPNNINFNKLRIDEFKSDPNRAILYDDYIIHQEYKPFLLGSFENIKPYTKYRHLFYAIPCIQTEIDLKCSNYVEWSFVIINMLYLLIINYSENDICAIVLLNNNKIISRKRQITDITVFNNTNNKKLVGFICAPYITPKLVEYPNNMLLLGVFENKEKTKDNLKGIYNYYSLYDINLRSVSIGYSTADYTVLYKELKLLFSKYVENKMYIYYDERIQFNDKLFISKKDNLNEKYFNLKKGIYSYINKHIYFYKEDGITILLKSVDEYDIPIYKNKIINLFKNIK